ncbi:MAG: OmpA family protein [Flavobacterium sp.]|nr:OmpA family protein [Flavobacterium sp.]
MRSKILFLIVLLVMSGNVFSQKGKIERANKKYDDYSYIDAIAIYEKVAAKGYKSVDLFERLGNAYYFNSEFEKAVLWYKELIDMQQEIAPEYYFRYAQSLKSSGAYERADEYMAIFTQKSANDARGKIFASNTDYLEKIRRNSGRFNIADAGVNSGLSDYGSAFLGSQLIFTTARDTGGAFKRKLKWTNQAFSNLYASEVKVDGTMAKPEKFTKNLNSRYNESSAIFTSDGKTMYFTRNNFNDGKKGKDDNNVVLLKLYKSTFDEIEWTDAEELPFNSDQYNTAHPALSPDERTLYFASDMPGSYGQSDLYKVRIYTDGSFGKPENLGPSINTEGKETFPFVSDEYELYFASDGHPGLGGLDVFVSKINIDDGSLGEIQNLGAPLNSRSDDFAFLIDSKSRNGFFSSNRTGGKGSDDIYKFTETRKIKCEQLLTGNIIDEETGDFLGNSQAMLFDEKMNVIAEMYATEQGYYSFKVPCNARYYVRANKVRYEINELSVEVPDETGNTVLNIPLTKKAIPFKKGDDVGPKLGIKMIYFDLDKSDIRPEAAVELQKISNLMQLYPSMKIDIRSHTDSRNTAKYNRKLSDARAKSTMRWLVGTGISPDRLTAKGYGESQLINKCADGIDCTEEEHQRNRRSEFIITSIGEKYK